MVTSFRNGVGEWLDSLLPADLYARTAGSAAAAEQAWLTADVIDAARAVPGVARVQTSRLRSLALAADRPPVLLIARALGNPAESLPLLEAPRPAGDGIGCFVSEAMVALYGAAPGSRLRLPLDGGAVDCSVRGVWRDYARQFGSVVLDEADYRRLSGDTRVNELALWLAPGADLATVRAALQALAPDPAMLDFASAGEIRAMSLRIFDRSFAVTRYLQVVAIVVGLVGVAASLSAQVLARRKEFGLLAHLGLTRRELIALVAGEAAAWLAAGALIGLALGAAISAVLVLRGQPAEFPLDDGPGAARGAAGRAGRGRAGRRHRHRRLQRTARRRPRRRAVGEGGLVKRRPLAAGGAAHSRRRQVHARAPKRSARHWCSRATTARICSAHRVVVSDRLAAARSKHRHRVSRSPSSAAAPGSTPPRPAASRRASCCSRMPR